MSIDLRCAHVCRMRVIERGDAAYPRGLEALSDPPARLHVAGSLPDPANPRVAVVGARRATTEGRDLAARLARGLAARGVVVVSGGAQGIDAAAHEGALAARGSTIVVLPTSIVSPYPRAHRRLFEAIVARGGALVTERELAEPVRRWHFVDRNRIVAALADVLVVVEARDRSGTAATAAMARRIGRPVGAFPWRPADEAGAGCLVLLKGGARLVTSTDDVVALLPADRPARIPAAEGAACGLVAVLALGGPCTAAMLAERVGRPLIEVLRELTALELAGEVVSEAGGRFHTLR